MAITQEELKKILHYDPDTGVFTWLISLNNRVKIGEMAGCAKKRHSGKSYRYIKIYGREYLSHRLVWLYINGLFPCDEIDHINGNGCDNRLINLRAVSHAENVKNTRKRINNTSGITGVCWCKGRNLWQAKIAAGKKEMHIGYFKNIFDAAASRKNAESKYGYHKNHGSDRPL